MPQSRINPTDALTGKQDSFFGDRSVVIPSRLLNKIKGESLTNDLYISDIGFYPAARYHFRQREKGIDQNILIYCIDGSGTLELNGEQFKIEANSWFVISANCSHTYFASEKNPWSIYWLHFGGPKSGRFAKYYGKVVQLDSPSVKRNNDRIILFNEILTILESGFSVENIDFANLYLNGLLASFFYSRTYCSVKGYQCKSPSDHAIQFMQKNIDKTLRIKDMADHVQMSASHFTKIFRNKTGSSPLDYFINLKMQEAIRLLTHKSMRIKETAFALGYHDPLYFSRIFTRHMGESPASYSRRWQNKSLL